MSKKRDQSGKEEIDEKTLDYKASAQEKQKKEGQMKNQAFLAERKILKVKKSEQPEEGSKKVEKKEEEVEKNEKEEKISKKEKPELQKKSEEPRQPQSNQKSLSQNEDDEKNQPWGSQLGSWSSKIALNFGNTLLSPAPQQVNGVGIFKKNLFEMSSFFKDSKSQFASSSCEFFEKPKAEKKPEEKEKPVEDPVVEQPGQESEEESSKFQKQLEKEQELKVEPEKSKGTYEYETGSSYIFREEANKIKKNSNEPIENVDVTLESMEKVPGTVISWVSVRLLATKNTIITGFIVKGKTEVKNLGGREENVVLSVIERKKQVSESTTLKIQFKNGETGLKFVEEVKNLLKE